MKLAKWHSYLVLYGKSAKRTGSRVSILGDLDSAIALWDSRTRISPVYGISLGAVESVKKLSFKGKSDLFFVGPVSPIEMSGLLSRLSGQCSAWITLGAFNFVLHLSNRDNVETVQQWVKQGKQRWERWILEGDRVSSTSHGGVSNAKQQLEAAHLGIPNARGTPRAPVRG